MRSVVKSLLLTLFLIVRVHAETPPTYQYETWGGGVNFTCDDNPCDPSCDQEGCQLQEDFVATEEQISKTPEISTVCMEEKKCFLSKNPENHDKCIWSGEGPNCEDKTKCCEYPIDKDGRPNKNRCVCRTKIIPEVKSEKCLDCLCLGEMANQPDVCKKKMICVAHNDAKAINPTDPAKAYCEAATGQVPTNRDAWRFSAARCICDRSTGANDDRGVNGDGKRGYSQIMCDCLEGKQLDHPTQKALAACEKARENLDCTKEPWTHYARGSDRSDCPCAKERIKSTEQCGDHIFCDCS